MGFREVTQPEGQINAEPSRMEEDVLFNEQPRHKDKERKFGHSKTSSIQSDPLNNRRKKNPSLEPTQDTNTDGEPSKVIQSSDQSEPLKPSFLKSLKRFSSYQTFTQNAEKSASRRVAQDTASDHEVPVDRPNFQSSSSQGEFERPKPKRRQTVPAEGLAYMAGRKAKANVRSRWRAAARGILLPLRRSKISETGPQTRGAEVISMLAAGAPAVNLVASYMAFDERSHRRVPVIVDLLRVFFLSYSRLMSRLTLSTQSNCIEETFCIALT